MLCYVIRKTDWFLWLSWYIVALVSLSFQILLHALMFLCKLKLTLVNAYVFLIHPSYVIQNSYRIKLVYITNICVIYSCTYNIFTNCSHFCQSWAILLSCGVDFQLSSVTALLEVGSWSASCWFFGGVS